jgi:hypothetical protein
VINHMRTALFSIVFTTVGCANSTLGTWKMDATRSTFAGGTKPKSLIVRIEPHAKGEVFTLDRIESDGRAISSSTVLYFDGTPREFEDFGCSGTQSSRRLDSQTMELLRFCATSEWIWLIRQSAVKSQELIIDITEKRDGRSNVEWRVVLKKQEVPNQ